MMRGGSPTTVHVQTHRRFPRKGPSQTPGPPESEGRGCSQRLARLSAHRAAKGPLETLVL